MKRILVVFTGGTIGSRIEGSTINVDVSMSRTIVKGFYDAYPNEQVQIDTVQPMNVLSENFTPKHWKIIADCLKEQENKHYDGIIITHGSDTISYTSAYISYIFSESQLPIVLTCSNYVLGHPKSNGRANFNNSVLLISRNNIKGVFSVFQNNKGENVVFLGTRMQEANPYDDQFTVCGGVDFGYIVDGKLITVQHPTNPDQNELIPDGSKKLVARFLSPMTNEICAIKAYPGLNYNNFSIGESTKAVLCNLYHSSSNCIGNDEYSLTEFIEKCSKKNIKVFLMSFKNTEGEHYLTTKTIMEAGGIPLVNISFEAAYVKLCVAYNQNEMSIKEFMAKEIYNEIL